MNGRGSKLFPRPGWWENVTGDEFSDQLRCFQAVTYRKEDIEFTHDLLVRDVPIGEAAVVEELSRWERLGFFRIGQLPVVYGKIDGRFVVRQKEPKPVLNR